MNVSQCTSRIVNGKSTGKRPSPDSYRDDRKQATSSTETSSAARPVAPANDEPERLDMPTWMSIGAWRGYLEINRY